MSVKILPIAFLTVAFGFVLGYIPGLNQHLHWNLWYVVPISGLLFGFAVGGLQFLYCFKTHQQVHGFLIFYLAAMALVGFATVDYGIYKSVVIPIQGVEGIPDGEYQLSEIITFWQYTKLNLGSSNIKTRYGTDTMEFGAVGTTISYVADLLGATLGTLGVLVGCRKTYPFCQPCQRYKQREQKYDILFKFDQSLADELLKGIYEQMESGFYSQIVAHLKTLASNHHDKKGDIKISVDQRCCPSCYEATFLGSVHRKGSRDWNEVEELKFQYDTQPEVAAEEPAAV